MDEFFLQYLWKFQKFQSPDIQLTNGKQLTVLKPGFQNHHSGPDFHEAKIKIDELIWSGSVEIHYKASDWLRHGHQHDKSYENVILHVVWIADQEILIGGEEIPTFEMSRHVDDQLERSYRNYINQPETIRCSTQFQAIHAIQKSAMLDRAITDRLLLKSNDILASLDEAEGDWEAVTYLMIAKSFGFKTNTNGFEKIVQHLPYKVVRKNHGNQIAMDALIFGTAGFLEEDTDEYQASLKKEFEYLQRKYDISSSLSRHHWKHSKMRPANFPSVRLAQFSAFLSQNQSLFNTLIHLKAKKDISSFLKKPVAPYWTDHYDFGKSSDRTTSLGAASLDLIMINTAVPLLAAYGKHLGEQSYVDQALLILESIKAETNHITKKWTELGLHLEHAADSQAVIHQYNHMCSKRKCLECNIGMSILHR